MNSQLIQKSDFPLICNELSEKGWVKISAVYSSNLLNKVKREINKTKKIFSSIQKENGIGKEAINSTHHTILLCPSMFALLDPNPINDFLEFFFNGKYILNTMGASFVVPGETVYTQKIHRDIRSFSGRERLLLNTLIMLDDSTENNGATWMLSGSHKSSKKPSDDYFYKNAERAIGKKGDLLIFDGNIWHAAGVNHTNAPRTIITPIYTKPFIKQALDYPRALGLNFQHIISDQLKQILGYNAITPQTLEEFYKPREKRFYKYDQG